MAKDYIVNDRQVMKGRQATREKPASVSEGLKRKKTEKRDFRGFVRAQNGARAKKGKRGRARGKSTAPLFPFFVSRPIFSRGQNTVNPIPRSFFSPQPHGNACYTD